MFHSALVKFERFNSTQIGDRKAPAETHCKNCVFASLDFPRDAELFDPERVRLCYNDHKGLLGEDCVWQETALHL